MATIVSQRGLFMIAAHEGIVPTRYRDLAGVDTFGIGHTSAAGNPFVEDMPFEMPKTDAEMDRALAAAVSVFERDIAKYEREVVAVVGDHLPQHVFDAVVSWHYNTGGVHGSRAVPYLQGAQYPRAADVIKQWNKVTVQGRKRVSEALRKRREQETDLMTTGAYPDVGGIPVWGTNGNGRVIWKQIDRLSLNEFARVLEDRAGWSQVTQDRTTSNDGRGGTSPVAKMIAGVVALVAGAVAILQNEVREVIEWLF